MKKLTRSIQGRKIEKDKGGRKKKCPSSFFLGFSSFFSFSMKANTEEGTGKRNKKEERKRKKKTFPSKSLRIKTSSFIIKYLPSPFFFLLSLHFFLPLNSLIGEDFPFVKREKKTEKKEEEEFLLFFLLPQFFIPKERRRRKRR